MNEELKRKFLKFLKQENCYASFYYYTRRYRKSNDSPPLMTGLSLFEKSNKYHWVSSAFIFRFTTQGFNWWMEVGKKWYSLCSRL